MVHPTPTPTETVRVEATNTPVTVVPSPRASDTPVPDTPTPFPEDTPEPTVIIERVEVEVPVFIRCVIASVNARVTAELAREAHVIVCPQ